MEFIEGKFPYTQAQVEKDRGSERKKVRAERDGEGKGEGRKIRISVPTQAVSRPPGSYMIKYGW